MPDDEGLGTAGIHTYLDRVSQWRVTLDMVRAAIVGAVPAELGAVAADLDGGLFSAFAFFALRGLSASYDVDLAPYLNGRGRATMDAVEQDCVFDLLDDAFVRPPSSGAPARTSSASRAGTPWSRGRRPGRGKSPAPPLC